MRITSCVTGGGSGDVVGMSVSLLCRLKSSWTQQTTVRTKMLLGLSCEHGHWCIQLYLYTLREEWLIVSNVWSLSSARVEVPCRSFWSAGLLSSSETRTCPANQKYFSIRGQKCSHKHPTTTWTVSSNPSSGPCWKQGGKVHA
jgi:hypothetical protein